MAGLLLLVGGAVALMSIVSAEALFPGPYSTGANEISELGRLDGPDGSEAAATIFNVSMVIVGGITVVAAGLLGSRRSGRFLAVPLAALGIGMLGVGFFPSGSGWLHPAAALLTFASGGVAAIVSAMETTAPFRFIALALGVTALVVLAVYLPLRADATVPGIGIGGLERWVAYPILLWSVGLGGYLAGGGELRRPSVP